MPLRFRREPCSAIAQDPTEILDAFGADALRLYLINSPVVRAEPLRFKVWMCVCVWGGENIHPNGWEVSTPTLAPIPRLLAMPPSSPRPTPLPPPSTPPSPPPQKEGVFGVVKDIFLPWYNAYRFLVQNVVRWELDNGERFVPLDAPRLGAATNVLDRWIAAAGRSLTNYVRQVSAVGDIP